MVYTIRGTEDELVTADEVKSAFEQYLSDGTLKDYSIGRVSSAGNYIAESGSTWGVNFDVCPKWWKRVDWSAGNGETDGSWVRRKYLSVKVTKDGGNVELIIIGTGG